MTHVTGIAILDCGKFTVKVKYCYVTPKRHVTYELYNVWMLLNV